MAGVKLVFLDFATGFNCVNSNVFSQVRRIIMNFEWAENQYLDVIRTKAQRNYNYVPLEPGLTPKYIFNIFIYI